MRRQVAALALAAATAAAVAAGCGEEESAAPRGDTAKQASGKPLVLANITDESFPGADWTVFRKAGEAAAQYINEELGGFGGRPIEIRTCDPKLNPAATTACANKAIEEDAFAEYGLAVSWGQAGLPVFEKADRVAFDVPTDDVEFSNPASFPLVGGSTAHPGMAKYICQQHPKSIVYLVNDLPSVRKYMDATAEVYAGCGVKMTPIYTNPQAVDITPDVAKAVKLKPDYFSMVYGNKQMVIVYKALQQAGIPGDRIIGPGAAGDTKQFFDLAGDSAEGTLMSFSFASWSDESNADVKLYHEVMEKYDGGNPNGMLTQGAFSAVMTSYLAAKAIGFDKFNAETLAAYLRETPEVPVFMGRPMANPAPNPEFPSVRQPYIRIVQWQNGKLVDKVTDNDGWFDPF